MVKTNGEVGLSDKCDKWEDKWIDKQSTKKMKNGMDFFFFILI